MGSLENGKYQHIPLAGAVGFEPTDGFPPPVFKTGAINRTRPHPHIGFTVFILTITTQQAVRLVFHNCFPIRRSGHYSLLSTGHVYSTPARRIVSHDRIIQQAKLSSQDLLLVGEVGVEPTQPKGNGFTDRPSSPTLALPYILL